MSRDCSGKVSPPLIDPKGWLQLSDQDLGFLLLAQFAEAQAAKLGLPAEQVTLEFIEQVRLHVLTLSADSARLASIEIALHAVASGDPEKAGRFYRETLVNGAKSVRAFSVALAEQNRLAEARSRGGKAAGKERKANSQTPRIIEEADKLERSGMPRRSISGAVAGKLGVTAAHVRKVLKKRNQA